MLLFALPLLLLLVGVLYQKIGAAADWRKYPPPGQRIDLNGIPYHIHVCGEGTPAVVFEAGVAASSVSWRPVQDAVSKFAKTAAYDRAGFAWSGPADRALSAAEMVETLRTLLQKAGLTPPYVFVGHSFGALLTRLYAEKWPEETAALVLLDPALLLEWASPTPAQMYRLNHGVMLSKRGAWLARIGFVRLSLSMLAGGSRALPKVFSKLSSGKGHSVSERLVGEVRKLPEELWPAVQSHWCRPESFISMARHLEELPRTAAAIEHVKPLGKIPVTVISGGHLTAAGAAEHAAIAASSSSGRHLTAKTSGHWVHLDDPQFVAEVVRETVHAIQLTWIAASRSAESQG